MLITFWVIEKNEEGGGGAESAPPKCGKNWVCVLAFLSVCLSVCHKVRGYFFLNQKSGLFPNNRFSGITTIRFISFVHVLYYTQWPGEGYYSNLMSRCQTWGGGGGCTIFVRGLEIFEGTLFQKDVTISVTKDILIV